MRVADGDLEVRVEARGNDETAILVRRFNRMLEDLKESQRRIAYLSQVSAWQGMARRLAHEIKNPLTPLLLVFQEMRHRYKGEDEQFSRLLEESYSIVREEIASLERLVEEFSHFARLPEVQAMPEELGSLLDEFLQSYGRFRERAEVGYDRPEEELLVPVDRVLLRRVLVNLVENAIQASPGRRPRIEIGVGTERAMARIVVEDDGPGVPDEIKDRIFEPQFTTRTQGLGLGLALVKKVALEHGGSVEVGSSDMGGASFRVLLPMG